MEDKNVGFELDVVLTYLPECCKAQLEQKWQRFHHVHSTRLWEAKSVINTPLAGRTAIKWHFDLQQGGKLFFFYLWCVDVLKHEIPDLRGVVHQQELESSRCDYVIDAAFFPWINKQTRTLSQLKGPAPQPSITFSCQVGGGGSSTTTSTWLH